MNKIKVEYKNIEELIPYINNPRLNSNAVDMVSASIQEFGFLNPIIIDEDNVIVAGHTRLKAAKKLNITEVPTIRAEDLTDAQIKAFRIADNRTTEFAEWDMEKLEIELEDLDDIFTGFDHDEIEEMFTECNQYDDFEAGSLAKDFIIPPVNIFDTRGGDWLARKRMWRSMIQEDGESRKQVNIFDNNLGKELATVSLLDPVLCEISYKWFSPSVDKPKSFDVFAGDTIFGYIAAYLGSEFTGIEIRKEQVDLNVEKMEEAGLDAKFICDDGCNVLNHFEENSQDLLFSCPPYFDLEVYSDLKEDASNQKTYTEFYKIIDVAFTNAIKVLKDNRFAVIVAGDIRNAKTGGYYGFIDDIKATFKNAGMIEYNNITLINSYGTAGMRARRAMKNRKVINVKQTVLVFYKGNEKNIQNEFKEIEIGDFEESEGEDI